MDNTESYEGGIGSHCHAHRVGAESKKLSKRVMDECATFTEGDINADFLICRLKCNRATPCENCVKRGDASSCVYAQAACRKKTQRQPHAPTSPTDMQNRIDRLEGLVLSLMTNGAQSPGPTAAMETLSAGGSSDSKPETEDTKVPEDESDTEQVTRSFGVMKFDTQSQKSYYVSEAHWASILSDVSS